MDKANKAMDRVLADLQSLKLDKALDENSGKEENARPEPKGVKLLLLLFAAVAIALMLSYIFSTFPLAEIIKSRWESELLAGNRLELEGFSIIFKNGTVEGLESLYLREQKNEFSACLLGEKKEGDYYIFSLYQPRMREQGFNRVVFEPCSPESLVILHTHPYKRCVASETDLQTLRKAQEENPDLLMVVMCEPGRFGVYD